MSSRPAATPLDNARHRVAERLSLRRPEIEDALFVRIRHGVPDPADQDDANYLRGLRSTVSVVLDYGISGILRGEERRASVPPLAALMQARRAARAGVRLDTVLRRYVAGYALLEDLVIEEANRTDSGSQLAVVRGVLQTTSALLDGLLASITTAYLQESAPLGQPIAAARISAMSGSGTATQRERIVRAMVEVVYERGFAGATVKLVTARAGVSSRTFYEHFGGLKDCFAAVLDLALERAGALIAAAFAREARWPDGVRVALASLLALFDSEPMLARVWFVEAMTAGSWALQRRERIVAQLREQIVRQWTPPGEQTPDPLAATGAMASVLGLIHTHLLTEQPTPLIELLGPLMGLVTSPYLERQEVEAEIERATQLARSIASTDPPAGTPGIATRQEGLGSEGWAGRELPAILTNPNARRARECLLFLTEHPGASNAEVSQGIAVAYQSQISKLLTCLLRERLVTKHSEGTGKRNAWRLTPLGEEIAGTLTDGEIGKLPPGCTWRSASGVLTVSPEVFSPVNP